MLHKKPPKTILIPAVIAAVAALILIPFSNWTAKSVYEALMGLPMNTFFYFARHLTGELYVILLCLMVWVFRRQYRATLVSFLLALALAGMINETIKLTARRVRPAYTVLAGEKQLNWVARFIEKHPQTAIRAETKDQWLMLDPSSGFLDDHFQSFPSGHANVAFVIAAYLVLVFPRGRILWILLAAVCALARVRLRRHFLEDVLFGGALGWLVAHWVFTWAWPVRWGKFLVDKVTPWNAEENRRPQETSPRTSR